VANLTGLHDIRGCSHEMGADLSGFRAVFIHHEYTFASSASDAVGITFARTWVSGRGKPCPYTYGKPTHTGMANPALTGIRDLIAQWC